MSPKFGEHAGALGELHGPLRALHIVLHALYTQGCEGIH